MTYFATPREAIEWLGNAHEKLRGPFSDQDFNQLSRTVPSLPSQSMTVCVPVWYSETVAETFTCHIRMLQLQYQETFWCWPELQAKHVGLIGGNHLHPGVCLRWEVINLDAFPRQFDFENLNKSKLYNKRQPGKSPHAGVLAVVAINPMYGRAIDSVEKPFLWIPGYELTEYVYGENIYRVPCILFHHRHREVRLWATWNDSVDTRWSVPELVTLRETLNERENVE